jgi:O-antigen/teichoic acid export membrane protein
MSRLLGAARNIAITRAAQPLLSLALIVAIGRVSSAMLGVYTIVTAWFVILQTLPLLGLGPLLSRDLAIEPARAGTVIGSTVALGSGVAALLGLAVAAAVPLQHLARETGLAVLLAAACMFPSTLVFVSELYYVSIHDTRTIVRVSLVENAFRAASGLLAVGLGFGVATLFATVLAGRLAAAVWYAWHLRYGRRVSLHVSRAAVAALLRRCPVYALNAVVLLVVSRADFLFLSAAVPLEEIASYGVAYKFLEFGLLLSAAFAGALYPHLARATTADDWHAVFAPVAAQSAKFILLFASVACALLFVNADTLVRLLFPRQHPGAVPLLRLLVPALFFAAFKDLASAILFSTARPRADLGALIAGAASYVVLLAVLVPTFGAWGAALATLLEAVVQLAVRWVAVARHFDPGSLRHTRLPTAATGALALGAAAALLDRLPGDPAARLAASAATAALFVGVLLRAGVVRSGDLVALGAARGRVP